MNSFSLSASHAPSRLSSRSTMTLSFHHVHVLCFTSILFVFSLTRHNQNRLSSSPVSQLYRSPLDSVEYNLVPSWLVGRLSLWGGGQTVYHTMHRPHILNRVTSGWIPVSLSRLEQKNISLCTCLSYVLVKAKLFWMPVIHWMCGIVLRQSMLPLTSRQSES